jgi:DNA recombination protein RmuC
MESVIYIVMTVLCVVAYAVGLWQGARSAKSDDYKAKALSQELVEKATPGIQSGVAGKVQPLLEQVEKSLKDLQANLDARMQDQNQAIGQVRESVKNVRDTAEALSQRTLEFTNVLGKNSGPRGTWGEQTLQRVLELWDMQEFCDFSTQSHAAGVRADVVIKLPNGLSIVIDAKAPALEEAIQQLKEEWADPQGDRKESAKKFAKRLRDTVSQLASRDYASKVAETYGLKSIDMTVLFLPADSLLSAALSGDADLVHQATRSKILIATPATLMAMLSSVAVSVREYRQEQSERKIADTAATLYERVSILVKHLSDVRQGVIDAANGLDKVIGSYEGRVRPISKRLEALGVKPPKEPLPELELTEVSVREMPVIEAMDAMEDADAQNARLQGR